MPRWEQETTAPSRRCFGSIIQFNHDAELYPEKTPCREITRANCNACQASSCYWEITADSSGGAASDVGSCCFNTLLLQHCNTCIIVYFFYMALTHTHTYTHTHTHIWAPGVSLKWMTWSQWRMCKRTPVQVPLGQHECLGGSGSGSFQDSFLKQTFRCALKAHS